MFATVLDDQYNKEIFSTASGPSPLAVSASVQIGAEPCRVLYALAIPEYIEAWLQFPEADRIECHPERRSFDRFRIDLFSANVRVRSIYGSCLLSKPNRITYLWERDLAGDRPKSTVEIRLSGGPEYCTLKLRHSGFVSKHEEEWHSSMWPCSLKKLCGLMEGIGCTRENANMQEMTCQ